VDACQTYAEKMQLARTLPGETFPYGQPLTGQEQFGLYAAGPGQAAVNLGAGRAGLFSQAVMAELDDANADWPPDMDAIAAGLDRRFMELRAAGRTAQTPTSYRWRTWTGSERVLGFATPGMTAAGTPQGKPSAATLRDMTDRLLDISAVADHDTRASIVRQLRKGLATSIAHAPTDRAHVVNIVSRCLRYRGGLAELLEVIRLYADPEEPALGAADVAARRLAAETGREWPA
jgi:hypothetical protein